MSIGNHEVVQHIENCESCQTIQNIIDKFTTKDREQTKEIQITISVLFDLQMECFIESYTGNL